MESIVQMDTKKKGRRKKTEPKDLSEKPKPSKKTKITIITSMNKIESTQHIKPSNVILQLSCSLREIDDYSMTHVLKSNGFSYNPSVPSEIQAYDHPPYYCEYQAVPEPDEYMHLVKYAYLNICSKCNDKIYSADLRSEEVDNTNNTMLKLKQLKIQLYNNTFTDKKSDCFWCTYPYDNQSCYVLQNGSKNEILGHGSFCSPECAVAYLFSNMKWDDSTKTESYQLMNEYYGKPTNYQHSIKPACSPYYLLEKYYGNMTIQEFRKMAKSKHMLLVVEKPVTRILPEIHEDTDHFLSNGTNVNYRGNYKVKKQSEKTNGGPSRTSILRDNFGMAQ